jgi:hypothetical protein
MITDVDAFIREIDAALENGFRDSSEEDLERFIVGMCHLVVTNKLMGERYLMRGITLNHIKAARQMETMNQENADTQKLVVMLALVAIGVGVSQVIVGLLGLCTG